MGFNVQEMLDPLDYDFHPYVDAAGVTPEPSDDQMKTAQAGLAEIFPVNEKGELDLKVLAERVTTVEEGSALEARLFEILAGLTSGQPSADEMKALPFRAQRAYMGWLMGKLLNPEA